MRKTILIAAITLLLGSGSALAVARTRAAPVPLPVAGLLGGALFAAALGVIRIRRGRKRD